MRILRFALIALLTACAVNNNVWYKANSTQEMFAKDRYACLQQAQQPNSTAYYGDYGGALQTKQYTANAGMVTNNPLFTACMNSRGWSWVSKDSVNSANNASQSTKQATANSVKEELDQIAQKIKAVCADAKYAAFYAKTSCQADDLTMAQMTDKSKISPLEKLQLDEVVTVTKPLIAQMNNVIRRSGNSKDSKVVDYRETVQEQALQKNRLDLYEGKETWGDYNRRRKEISDMEKAERKRLLQ